MYVPFALGYLMMREPSFLRGVYVFFFFFSSSSHYCFCRLPRWLLIVGEPLRPDAYGLVCVFVRSRA